jgi:drug/metabolite transporter (DMT)-like permease
VILQERLALAAAVGGAIILFGVWLVTRPTDTVRFEFRDEAFPEAEID